MRFFNTTGPVNPADHYSLSPLSRFDLDDVLSLIAAKRYFVLHDPRQTGKTTCLLALVDTLNQSGACRALYANLESGQSARENVAEAMQAILSEIAHAAQKTLGDRLMLDRHRAALAEAGPHGALFFRENSESWSRRFDYQEAWPQLLIQAFLQRVVNGGGQVHREYGPVCQPGRPPDSL